MTTTDKRYLDGWQDGLRHVRHEIAATNSEPGPCLGCILDRSVFAGIVAALDDDHDQAPAAVLAQIRDDAADALLAVAMDPDLEQQAAIVGLCRRLVTEQPAVAADVLTIYALGLARHYAATYEATGADLTA